MTVRILADENIPAVEHYAGTLATVKRFNGRSLRADHLADTDVLLVRSVTRVDADLLANSKVRFVGSATSGIDHIDRDYLRLRGIEFRHAPGSNANSVVEYVLAAIASVDDYLEQILAGAAVGIVGSGVIGNALAARLQALDVKYLSYDPWLDQSEMQHATNLSGILECRVISLHAELTRELPWPSYHLLDESTLARLTQGRLLINASRGAVVDNAALLQRLERGGGPDVVLDVWEGEPAISQALLRRVQIGTPHIAGYSLDGKLLATRMLLEAMTKSLGLPWTDPGSAAGEAPVLRLAEHISRAALLRQILSQRYDVSADDARLRSVTLGADGPVAAAGFDQLRRTYPERREILGSRVLPGAFTEAAESLLRGLGCVIATSR